MASPSLLLQVLQDFSGSSSSWHLWSPWRSWRWRTSQWADSWSPFLSTAWPLLVLWPICHYGSRFSFPPSPPANLFSPCSVTGVGSSKVAFPLLWVLFWVTTMHQRWILWVWNLLAAWICSSVVFCSYLCHLVVPLPGQRLLSPRLILSFLFLFLFLCRVCWFASALLGVVVDSFQVLLQWQDDHCLI